MVDAEKREKVIRGLECCISSNIPEDCLECPYGRERNYRTECIRPLMRDALVLLKEQEPRVMTAEEVRECDDWMWVEYQSGYCGWQKPTVDGYDEEGILWDDATFDLHDAYGDCWRCWTSRPSPEQMRDTPWEGEKV